MTRADVQQFTSFDGLPISYSVQGSGPDVLLMHGFAATADRNWFAPGIAAALLASDRRVIAYDARGHGASGKPHDPARYADGAMVRDAQALLDHVGVSTVDVVGYSMGALMASRLVPVEPRSRSLVLGGIGGRLLRRKGGGLNRPLIADALEAHAGSTIDDASARAFRVFAERSGNDLLALAAIQRAPQHGTSGVLAQIAVPTLVVAGADDRLAGSPQALAARITGAVGVVVPGDHLSAVGKPELTQEIVGFLARVSPL